MQDESLIKLLSETLKFYAEEANYVNDQINKDKGFQARHALKLVTDNRETMQGYEKMFEEFEQKADEKTTPEELIEMLNKLKEDGR